MRAVMISLLSMGLVFIPSVCLAQPKIPKMDIPSGIAGDISDAMGQLYSLDPAVRGRAVVELGDMGERAEAAVPFLVGILGEADSFMNEGEETMTSVGDAAARALVNMGRSSVGPLINSLKDEDYRVRARAAWALGEIGDHRAEEPLLEALNDSYGFASGNAADALGKMRVLRAVKPLIAQLNSRHWPARRGAARALGELGDKRAVGPLVEALSDRSGDVRAAASDALRKLTGEDFGQDVHEWQRWLREQ